MVDLAATTRTVQAVVERHWVQEGRPERLILLGARPEWAGGATVAVGDVTAAVVPASSTLAVRDALVGAGSGGRVVVLTNLGAAEIGADLLSRAVRHQVLRTDLWDTVRLHFGLRADAVLDATLVRDGEVLARALVDLAPPGRWETPPSGVLTRDHAYRELVRHLLRLAPGEVGPAGLLDWSRDHAAVLALHELEPRLRGRLVTWLVHSAGPDARPVVELAARGEGPDAVPLGLVAGALWEGAGDPRAQGRFERFLGRGPTWSEAHEWYALASAWVQRRVSDSGVEGERGLDEARSVLERAEQLLDELGATGLVESSELLPAGLVRRQHVLASALGAWAQAPSPRHQLAAEAALTRLRRHLLAALPSSAGPWASVTEALHMGVRLMRWSSARPPRPEHLHGAVVGQVREGGWVDRARQVLVNGVEDGAVQPHLAAVEAQARQARAEVDDAASTLLSAATAQDQPRGALIPVEDGLARLRERLGAQPALVCVLDGMSAAVATEVVESAMRLGWVEHSAAADGGREPLLAALPTLTRVSRTSLLSGELVVGEQTRERAGFTAVMGPGSVLYHQSRLGTGPGSELAPDVRAAVGGSEHHFVGAVMNAVDDSLSGGDPGRTRWTVDAVRYLRPLLERAAAAGRVVVLTSDHGHVVHHPDGILKRHPHGGARWHPRAEGDETGEGEVRLAGRRVLEGGGDVIAAVDERLRFAPAAEGYHGGAALAEIAIPWVVLARRGTEVPRHQAVELAAPAWWDERTAVEDVLGGDEGAGEGRLL